MQSIAEVWKDIQGYEGLYQVSNLGRVKSYYGREERILKAGKNRNGYLFVRLSKNEKVKDFRVHRLVALAFIPNPENKPQIDHINTIKTDNNINNLRWVSHKENMNNPLTLVKTIGKNNPFYGKKHSEETKRIISYRLSGKNNPRSRAIRNIETKEIFDTVTDASIKYNVYKSTIVHAIKNNWKCAGYHWEYV